MVYKKFRSLIQGIISTLAWRYGNNYGNLPGYLVSDPGFAHGSSQTRSRLPLIPPQRLLLVLVTKWLSKQFCVLFAVIVRGSTEGVIISLHLRLVPVKSMATTFVMRT
jgi:hypothetical protein